MEEQIKRRVAIGSFVSERKLVDELVRWACCRRGMAQPVGPAFTQGGGGCRGGTARSLAGGCPACLLAASALDMPRLAQRLV